MNYTELYDNIRRKGSFLCVGLDTDPEKIPACVREHHADAPMLAFNKAIIDATAEYAVAYKPNIAFYEAEGVAGWQQLAETVRYIRSNYPDILIIADAKRGDIGNTADRYAKAFFETMDFDAVTLAPYMGSDSIRPFLKHSGRWGIVLAMTSNKSAEEFETLPLADGAPLYERIIHDTVRSSLEEVARCGLNSHCGLLINSSRGIIYASSGEDFAEAAGTAAADLANQMRTLL